MTTFLNKVGLVIATLAALIFVWVGVNVAIDLVQLVTG